MTGRKSPKQTPQRCSGKGDVTITGCSNRNCGWKKEKKNPWGLKSNNRNRLVERLSNSWKFPSHDWSWPWTTQSDFRFNSALSRRLAYICDSNRYMGETLASSTSSFLQILHETFSILQILFIMIRHQGSVWMRALLYPSLAQKPFKIGSYTAASSLPSDSS